MSSRQQKSMDKNLEMLEILLNQDQRLGFQPIVRFNAHRPKRETSAGYREFSQCQKRHPTLLYIQLQQEIKLLAQHNRLHGRCSNSSMAMHWRSKWRDMVSS